MLSAHGIYKSYGTLQILKGVDLEVQKGEIISIVGASGAGKSTFLHILGSLDMPDKGTVLLNGTDLSKLSTTKLSAFRNAHIGFIFQFHHLLPEFTALENICIPAFIAGEDKKAAEKRAKMLLEMLNIGSRADHKPTTLSGGEQQRVAVARALMNNPEVILADEPSGNLDSENATALHHLFVELRNQLQQTFVIVTHNEHLAEISDRTVHMKDGCVI
ncbi:ABC transporter ATP-binding protein [Olivibacter ginsenosidimutans]|uniref:ABC transporter ATP-binding protein n=1 Tax=Olivibacter ginsenosidimutans TaxID=1176537 RepID=A0ABP9B201_9SPHI